MTSPYPMQPTPSYAPEPPKKKRGGFLKTVVLTLAVFLLIGVGYGAGKGGSAAAELSAPAPAVTVTTAGESSGVPQSCLRALDEADEIIAIFGETMSIVSDAFTAAANFDSDELSRQADKIGDQTAKITASGYPTYANACRSES